MKNQIIEELINTRINGNNIKNNQTYLNMIKSITKEDINQYCLNMDYSLVYGNKIEMIEQIKNQIIGA